MITNGSMLDRHDISLLVDCGLTELQISIDTVDPLVHEVTRVNTDLPMILANISSIKAKYPNLDIAFSAVVNALTIGGIEDLLEYGQSIGVAKFYLREIANRGHLE